VTSPKCGAKFDNNQNGILMSCLAFWECPHPMFFISIFEFCIIGLHPKMILTLYGDRFLGPA
jgi:hypothetical protein